MNPMLPPPELHLDAPLEAPGHPRQLPMERIAQLEKEIAERRGIELELRGKTTFFDAFVNSSLDGILVIDHKGKKLLQNRQAVEMWKIPDKIAASSDGDA